MAPTTVHQLTLMGNAREPRTILPKKKSVQILLEVHKRAITAMKMHPSQVSRVRDIVIKIHTHGLGGKLSANTYGNVATSSL